MLRYSFNFNNLLKDEKILFQSVFFSYNKTGPVYTFNFNELTNDEKVLFQTFYNSYKKGIYWNHN